MYFTAHYVDLKLATAIVKYETWLTKLSNDSEFRYYFEGQPWFLLKNGLYARKSSCGNWTLCIEDKSVGVYKFFK